MGRLLYTDAPDRYVATMAGRVSVQDGGPGIRVVDGHSGETLPLRFTRAFYAPDDDAANELPFG